MEGPSPYGTRGLRRLAKRRGYTLHKVRGKDRFYLEDDENGLHYVARNDAEGDDVYFTRHEISEYLRYEEPDEDE